VGAGVIWQYGRDSQTIAVGSTASSGDPKMDAKFPPLNWDEFARDLIVARHFSKRVGVYSLEGCVRQGFIARLKGMDWNQQVVIPAQSAGKAAGFRKFVFAVLWVGSHIMYLAVALMLVLTWLVRLLVRRRRRKRAARLMLASSMGTERA
jgi:Flp pilus assembly protein TadB